MTSRLRTLVSPRPAPAPPGLARRAAWRPALAVALAVVAGCGGGRDAPDAVQSNAEPVAAPTGADSFLLFPNPQLQADGSSQLDANAYAQAYFQAIDPNNDKDTLARWKAANGFDSGSGQQLSVVFGDVRDLGYGRRLTGRMNADGSIAFVVENYLVSPGGAYGYSPLSLQAALQGDSRWRVGVNAIEFSPGPNGGVAFAKFFNFNPVSGARELRVDLDGRGAKAMPGVCISCHGGRGDALARIDATGQTLFNLVENAKSGHRGDVQGRLHPFEVPALDFASAPGFTRDDQEAALKTLNKMVLCTYPDPAAVPADCGLVAGVRRRAADPSEWQGGAAALITAAYGGVGLTEARYTEPPVPADWAANGQSTLYREVFVRSCRACHQVRGSGSGAGSDIDFASFSKFDSFAARIKSHTFDRGDMPLAKIVYDAFASSPQRSLMAGYLASRGLAVTDAQGALLAVGRPVADPGPDRVVAPGRSTLSAAGSLFASRYRWALLSGPAGARLNDADSVLASVDAATSGTYQLQLVVGNGSAQSTPQPLTLVVSNALNPAPAAIRFDPDIKAVMAANCMGCHGAAAGPLPRPPVFYDAPSGGTSLYAAVRSRINFKDIGASPLLTKPAGQHHGGGAGPILDFDIENASGPGDPLRVSYDLFLNWILAGAPP